MHKRYTLLLSFLLFSGQSKCSQYVSDALSYIPVNSNTTNAIVYGTRLTVAAATFWALHEIKCMFNNNNSSQKQNKSS